MAGSLLAVDIGNTNTVLGVYDGDDLVAHWRIQTSAGRTADEYAALVHQLMQLQGLEAPIAYGILSSVVPQAVFSVKGFFEHRLKVPALVVGPGIKSGMPILYENPREVGADRIVNAVAAYERFKSGCVVIDFGTATTWDVVSPKGEYLGGIIAPGVQISSEALYAHAAKLPRVEIRRPSAVVGRNTVASMQSGLFYGYIGMIDRVVDELRAELDFETRCIATGGLARLFEGHSRAISTTDEMLTLRGLKILFERNR